MARKWLKRMAYMLGYDFTIRRLPQYDLKRKEENIPRDMEDKFVDAYELSKAFTMTSAQRMYALYSAVRYVVENRLEGDFVECGVWRGRGPEDTAGDRSGTPGAATPGHGLVRIDSARAGASLSAPCAPRRARPRRLWLLRGRAPSGRGIPGRESDRYLPQSRRRHRTPGHRDRVRRGIAIRREKVEKSRLCAHGRLCNSAPNAGRGTS